MKKSEGKFKNILNKIDENITHQNLWDITKVVLMGKFIVLNAYISMPKKVSDQHC